jgi:hypothetical protein
MATNTPSGSPVIPQPAQTRPLPPTVTNIPAASPVISQPAQTRPLRRESAIVILSSEERALEDAMLRSSPVPDPTVLGKRTRSDNDDEQLEEGDNNTEQGSESETPLTLQPSVIPTISNVTVATLRYATQKRLRAEQRGELEAFLLVSTSLMHFATCV